MKYDVIITDLGNNGEPTGAVVLPTLGSSEARNLASCIIANLESSGWVKDSDYISAALTEDIYSNPETGESKSVSYMPAGLTIPDAKELSGQLSELENLDARR